MRQLPRTHLWIGDRGDVRDPSTPRRLNILAVVDLAMEEEPLRLDRERAVIRIPLIDGAGNDPHLVGLAIGVVEALLVADLPALVLCSAGMSRAPAIAAGALSRVTGQSPDEALSTIRALGPAHVAPALWASVTAAAAQS